MDDERCAQRHALALVGLDGGCTPLEPQGAGPRCVARRLAQENLGQVRTRENQSFRKHHPEKRYVWPKPRTRCCLRRQANSLS